MHAVHHCRALYRKQALVDEARLSEYYGKVLAGNRVPWIKSKRLLIVMLCLRETPFELRVDVELDPFVGLIRARWRDYDVWLHQNTNLPAMVNATLIGGGLSNVTCKIVPSVV